MSTMSISGGILTYTNYNNNDNNDNNDTRYLNEESPKGRKVKFLGHNGYDLELNHAKKILSVGQVLTVEEIYVGRSSSKVEFKEYPKMYFNTVMFADVDTDGGME